jgi:hypothetical protein
MTPIPFDQFVSFVRTLEGEVIRTRAGNSYFAVRVLDSGLEFTPQSTRTPRRQTIAITRRVLDHFDDTKSWITTDYRFARSASYQLTLIDRFLAARKGQSR